MTCCFAFVANMQPVWKMKKACRLPYVKYSFLMLINTNLQKKLTKIEHVKYSFLMLIKTNLQKNWPKSNIDYREIHISKSLLVKESPTYLYTWRTSRSRSFVLQAVLVVNKSKGIHFMVFFDLMIFYKANMSNI